MNRRASKGLAGVLLGATLLIGFDAHGQSFPDLAAVARNEVASFRREELQLRAENCRAALNRLNSYLNGLGDREREKWHRLLRWTELHEQVQRPTPDPNRFSVLSKRFYATQRGLEVGPFLDARAALDQYASYYFLVAGKSNDELTKEFLRRREVVARLLEARNTDHDALREQVSWFAIVQQAPELCEHLRGEFRHPNLVIHVARQMLPKLGDRFDQEISRSNWSINTILGRRVEGMTHFHGGVTGGLLRNRPNAVIKLTLDGTVHAPSNTAYAGALLIFSRTETAVRATKELSWTGAALVGDHADVTADPDTTITGAQVCRRRLLRRSRLGDRIDNWLVNIALQRACQSQPQARCEVANITAKQIAQQFDNAVRSRVEELNRDVAYYYTHPLVRVGMLPGSRGVPTDSGISLQFRIDGLNQLAAPGPPEETLEGDINVYIHESAFPNLVQRYAAGGEWKDEFFARIQKEAIGDYSVEMRIREREERWSLILGWLQPWSTRITEDGVEFTVNASGFAIDGKAYSHPLVVRSTFVPILAVGPDVGWKRVGEVQIDSPSEIDAATRKFLHRKLSGFFLDRFFLDGLNAPAGGPWNQLSTVSLVNVELVDAWLRLEFKQTVTGSEGE